MDKATFGANLAGLNLVRYFECGLRSKEHKKSRSRVTTLFTRFMARLHTLDPQANPHLLADTSDVLLHDIKRRVEDAELPNHVRKMLLSTIVAHWRRWHADNVLARIPSQAKKYENRLARNTKSREAFLARVRSESQAGERN